MERFLTQERVFSFLFFLGGKKLEFSAEMENGSIGLGRGVRRYHPPCSRDLPRGDMCVGMKKEPGGY